MLPIRPPRAIRARSGSPTQWGTATLFAIPAFLVLYVVLAVIWRPPATVALAYLVMSLLTFAAYAKDKASAHDGRRRMPETRLHLMALLGGWPGALLAQQFVRHKSAKRPFRQTFWLTVALNVAGFVLLCSPLWRSALAPT